MPLCYCWTGSACTVHKFHFIEFTRNDYIYFEIFQSRMYCNPGCSASDGKFVVAFQCSCPAGFTGPACLTACSGNKYGPNCARTCTCHNGASCDPVTGKCNCTAGWQGVACESLCSPGTYGVGCLSCNCQNGATCHHVTGQCFCSPGYVGNL
jgi:hypothetical protein